MSIPQCECAEGSNQRAEMWSDSAHVTRVIRFFSEFGSKFFRFEQNQSVCCQCCLRIPECRAVTVQRHSVKHWLGPARPSGAIRRLFKTFTIYFLNEKKKKSSICLLYFSSDIYTYLLLSDCAERMFHSQKNKNKNPAEISI